MTKSSYDDKQKNTWKDISKVPIMLFSEYSDFGWFYFVNFFIFYKIVCNFFLFFNNQKTIFYSSSVNFFETNPKVRIPKS